MSVYRPCSVMIYHTMKTEMLLWIWGQSGIAWHCPKHHHRKPNPYIFDSLIRIFRNHVQILNSSSFKTFFFFEIVFRLNTAIPGTCCVEKGDLENPYPHLCVVHAVLGIFHIMVWVNTWTGNSNDLRWKRVPDGGIAMVALLCHSGVIHFRMHLLI